MIRLSFGTVRSIGAVVLLGALAACTGSRGGPIPYGGANLSVPDPPRAVVMDANYRVTTGDKLRITVYQVEALSRDYDVGPSGNIEMPLIGSVPAVGQTVQQLRTVIAARLGQRYLRDPDVTVSVTESPASNVTVDGSVRQPGSYPVRGPMTLMEAIAVARGADENANLRRVAIFRRVDGQRMAAAFDLVSIRRGEMPDPTIYAGDIIVVDGNAQREMLRQVFGALPILALFRPY
jgi:polysaccharide biosynthesis/export protein